MGNGSISASAQATSESAKTLGTKREAGLCVPEDVMPYLQIHSSRADVVGATWGNETLRPDRFTPAAP
jgi:hypothetical protein